MVNPGEVKQKELAKKKFHSEWCVWFLNAPVEVLVAWAELLWGMNVRNCAFRDSSELKESTENQENLKVVGYDITGLNRETDQAKKMKVVCGQRRHLRLFFCFPLVVLQQPLLLRSRIHLTYTHGQLTVHHWLMSQSVIQRSKPHPGLIWAHLPPYIRYHWATNQQTSGLWISRIVWYIWGAPDLLNLVRKIMFYSVVPLSF